MALQITGSEDAPTFVVPPRPDGARGVLPLAAAAALLPLVVPRYWIFCVTVGLVLAIACLGLLVLTGWAGEISLMQAGLTGSALYLSYYLYADRYPRGGGMWFPLAAAIGVSFAVVMSVLVALVSVRLAGAYVIVLTLSIQFLLENSAMSGWTVTDEGHDRPHFFGLSLKTDERFYYLVLGVLIVILMLLHRLRHSRFGRALILVGSDEQLAAVVGVSPWAYRVGAFGIAGLLAGVAGVLSGPLYFSQPGNLQYISFNSLFYLSIPVLAGYESPIAVVGIAVVITLIPQMFLDAKINVYLLGGVGLAVGVFLGPRGLTGAVSDLFGGRRRRGTRAIGPPAPPPTRRTT